MHKFTTHELTHTQLTCKSILGLDLSSSYISTCTSPLSKANRLLIVPHIFHHIPLPHSLIDLYTSLHLTLHSPTPSLPHFPAPHSQAPSLSDQPLIFPDILHLTLHSPTPSFPCPPLPRSLTLWLTSHLPRHPPPHSPLPHSPSPLRQTSHLPRRPPLHSPTSSLSDRPLVLPHISPSLSIPPTPPLLHDRPLIFPDILHLTLHPLTLRQRLALKWLSPGLLWGVRKGAPTSQCTAIQLLSRPRRRRL